jgi:hypothetical protein
METLELVGLFNKDYREDAKDAKLREVRLERLVFLRATSRLRVLAVIWI